MGINEHGSCVHCGFDLNGEMIYDYFLKMNPGDSKQAVKTAAMYGATETTGRFGKAIYVKGYDSDYNKLKPYFMCPKCMNECYAE